MGLIKVNIFRKDRNFVLARVSWRRESHLGASDAIGASVSRRKGRECSLTGRLCSLHLALS